MRGILAAWNALFEIVSQYRTPKICFFTMFRGVSSSICPKFRKLYPCLFILHTCHVFPKYAFIRKI